MKRAIFVLFTLLLLANAQAQIAPFYGTGSFQQGTSFWRQYSVVFDGENATLTQTAQSLYMGSPAQLPLVWPYNSATGRYENGGYWLAYQSATTMSVAHSHGSSSGNPATLTFDPPEPDPLEIDADVSGFEGGIAAVLVDLQGDGNFVPVAQFEVDSSGHGEAPWDEAWDGKDYRIDMVSQTADGNQIPLGYNLGGGTFGDAPPAPLTPQISNETPSKVGVVSIGGSGQVVKQEVIVQESTINGSPVTSYTHYNNSGHPTSTIYSNAGTSAATAGDIRLASAKNSQENDAILDALNDISDKLTPSPTPEPEPTPDEESTSDYLAARQAAASSISGSQSTAETPPTVSSGDANVSGGDPSLWIINIGGNTLNLNPMSNPKFQAFAAFVRNLVAYMVSAYVLYYIALLVWQFQTELHKIQQTHGYPLNVAASILGTGGATNAPGLLMAEIAATVIVIAITSSITLIATAAYALGDASLSISNVTTALNSHGSNASIAEGIKLLDKFFPIQHVLTVMANYVLVVLFRNQLYGFLAAVRKFLPA